MTNDKTLSEHLRVARAARNPDNLRAGMAEARAKRQPPKPCNCGRTDGTHGYKCPVYLRAAQQKSRNRPSPES